MKAALWIIPFFLILSCTSLQKDLVVESNGGELNQELSQWELALVVCIDPHFEGDLGHNLDRINQGLSQLDDPSVNRQYLANLHALKAWHAWLSGNWRQSETFLEMAMEQDDREELVILVRSFLAETREDSLLILQEENPGHYYRLSAQEAALLFELGDYGSTLTLLDEALNHLPEEYKKLYQNTRDKAWELKEGNIRGDVTAYLDDSPLEMDDMIGIVQIETLLLDDLSRQNQLRDNALYKELQRLGYISENKPANRTADRSDAALLLWNLLIEKENQPQWRGLYEGKFESSPIEDVPLDSPWFEAVLGCVEREILYLPDGRLFFPGLLINGLEFLEMLKAVEEY